MPLGIRIQMADRVLSPASPMDVYVRFDCMNRLANHYGFSVTPYIGRRYDEALERYIGDNSAAFRDAIEPHFSRELRDAARSATPYETYARQALILSGLELPLILKSGFVAFDAASEAIDRIHEDTRSILSIFKRDRYSRRQMAKRSALYKLFQLSMVGFTGAAISTSPAALLVAGGLATASIATFEGRILWRTYHDLQIEMVVSGRDIGNPFSFLAACMMVRRDRIAIMKLAADMSIR